MQMRYNYRIKWEETGLPAVIYLILIKVGK